MGSYRLKWRKTCKVDELVDEIDFMALESVYCLMTLSVTEIL